MDSDLSYRLTSNYNRQFYPTSYLIQENEYERRLIEQMKNAICQAGLQTLTLEDKGIDVGFGFTYRRAFNKFYITLSFWNETGKTSFIADRSTVNEISNRMDKIIDCVNEANIMFVTFEDDNAKRFEISNGIIYGAIYDLDKDAFIELPKVTKTALKFGAVDKENLLRKLEAAAKEN